MEQTSINTIVIACGSDRKTPPFHIDVTVVEEDTWQVLAAGNAAPETHEHPIRLMTSLIEQKPVPAGELIIHGNEWRLVVVDLDQDPVCGPISIARGLVTLALQIEKHRISGISLPILGLSNDCIQIDEFIKLLKTHILENSALTSLQHLWLRVPEGPREPVRQALYRLCSPP